jgi:hypothetical protein
VAKYPIPSHVVAVRYPPSRSRESTAPHPLI